MSISIDPTPFLIKIWDAAAWQLQYLRRPKPRIDQLKEAGGELEAKAADINNSISQAQREGQIPSNQIQLWMSKVTEMKGKVEATEMDFDRMRCLCGWSWNCFSINRRVAKRLDEINQLKIGVDDTPIAKEPPPPAVVEMPTSDSTVAMEAYMSEILGYIASQNAATVIGLCGMGGVGKTTLLQSINNHKDVATFDHVIWAVASKECRMERLQMVIAKRLKLHLDEDESKDDRAAKLFDFLKNKDCLLLLDDLWEPLDLAKLGMTHATPGQGQQKRKVVVFTTRQKQVCGHMKASRKMEIKCLGPNQAWDLFRMNAGEDAIGSDVGIYHIAQQIAQECAGLPLALVTVGKAMSTKKSWRAWNDALALMKHSQMPKVTGMKEVDLMFSAFKLSYDSLEDDDMRIRLLSCAMWPEDHQIKIDELIQCWMSLGLIDEEGTIHRAYYRGHSHIETLKAACLLEPSHKNGEKVQMHDVIRDMALWMASDCGMKKFKWIVKAGVAASQVLGEEAWHEAERVSLMYNHDIISLPNQLSTCPKLSVLMLQRNRLKKISGSFIQSMCALTYLDLRSTDVEEIPKEIGMLSQLRYLNLSVTLISQLPAELGCLVKLNYLILKGTQFLRQVPMGTISNLYSLRLLDLRGSAYEDCFVELEGFKGCEKSISIDILTSTTLQCLCSLLHVSIWKVNVKILEDSDNLNELLNDFMGSRKIRQNMEELQIEHGFMDKLLISKRNEEASGFECLKYFNLYGLSELKEIMWKGVQPQIVFPNLREMRISSCEKLRNINWVLQLPHLSVLHVYDCGAMEELINDEDNSRSSSFRITELILCTMINLKRISHKPLSFPYLEKIAVIICPLVKKLPFDNQTSNNRLKEIQCESKWWDNLEWEDASMKDALAPLVKSSDWESDMSSDLFIIKFKRTLFKNKFELPFGISTTSSPSRS